MIIIEYDNTNKSYPNGSNNKIRRKYGRGHTR